MIFDRDIFGRWQVATLVGSRRSSGYGRDRSRLLWKVCKPWETSPAGPVPNRFIHNLPCLRASRWSCSRAVLPAPERYARSLEFRWSLFSASLELQASFRRASQGLHGVSMGPRRIKHRMEHRGMEWPMQKRLYSYLSDFASDLFRALDCFAHMLWPLHANRRIVGRHGQIMILLYRNYQTYPPSRR